VSDAATAPPFDPDEPFTTRPTAKPPPFDPSKPFERKGAPERTLGGEPAAAPDGGSFFDRIWHGISSAASTVEGLRERAPIIGGKPALQQSAETAVPYRPGMKMGEMVPPNWQQNPMLYSMGTGNVGRGVVPGKPAIGTATEPRRLDPAEMTGPSPTQVAKPGPLAGVIDQTAGSRLGGAIASNNPAAADEFIAGAFRNVVKPSRAGRKSAPQIGAQDRQILTTIDNIIENRHNLTFEGPNGQPMPGRGRLPQTLAEFSDAIDQQKRNIFAQYDAMAQTAEGGGVRVDLAPVIETLRGIAGKQTHKDVFPGLVKEAETLADNLEKSGSYTPGETQDLIQSMNRVLKPLYKNAGDSASLEKAEVLRPAADALREQLTAAIEGAGGSEYRALRQQYGALSSVEKDVAGAVQREANKLTGGLSGQFANILGKEEILRGMITLNPAAIGRGAAIQASRLLHAYLNSPNRAITRLFQRRANESRPLGFGPIGQRVGPAVVPAMRAAAIPDRQKQRPRREVPARLSPLE
jgi:hypothetical protein